MKGKCKFCEDYEYIRRQDKDHDLAARNDPECRVDLLSVQRVQLVSYFRRRYKGESRYHHAGNQRHKTYHVNYCPICGRRL